MANLTRYAVFHNERCDLGCGLMPQHDGPLVKFEDIKELLNTPTTREEQTMAVTKQICDLSKLNCELGDLKRRIDAKLNELNAIISTPKFKVGDKIMYKTGKSKYFVYHISESNIYGITTYGIKVAIPNSAVHELILVGKED